MRVLFATTANAGHFRPLVPFAEACLRAGHEVLVAGQAGAAPAAQRAGLSFRALAEPETEELATFQAGQEGLSATQAMGRALTELYIRVYARAALKDMLAVIEEWRPDVVVRESAEFSALVAAERLGVRHARVGIGLSTTRKPDAVARGPGARRAWRHGRSRPRPGWSGRPIAVSDDGARFAGRPPLTRERAGPAFSSASRRRR
ncbi:MAG TPA: hypothetical protein VES62_06685 [Thermoleophilaceae bacterium]|nr:hypothetical protein [Thermoleophilaceae bacterium]